MNGLKLKWHKCGQFYELRPVYNKSIIIIISCYFASLLAHCVIICIYLSYIYCTIVIIFRNLIHYLKNYKKIFKYRWSLKTLKFNHLIYFNNSNLSFTNSNLAIWEFHFISFLSNNSSLRVSERSYLDRA